MYLYELTRDKKLSLELAYTILYWGYEDITFKPVEINKN